MAMWQEAGALPQDVDPRDRARELVVVLYDGETLAGCITANIWEFAGLGEKFAFSRSFVRGPYRRARLTDRLAIEAHATLGKWASVHPEARLAGSGAIYQNLNIGARPVEPSGLALIGFTRKGMQKRVHWFDHFRLSVGRPAGEAITDPSWRLEEAVGPDDVDEICAFWAAHGALAPGRDRAEWAQAVTIVARDDTGRLIATSSAPVSTYPPLQRPFAMFRCFMAPEVRHPALWLAMLDASFRKLDSEPLPANGMIAVPPPELAPAAPLDDAGFILAGYTDKHWQVRLRWFGGVRVKE